MLLCLHCVNRMRCTSEKICNLGDRPCRRPCCLRGDRRQQRPLSPWRLTVHQRGRGRRRRLINHPLSSSSIGSSKPSAPSKPPTRTTTHPTPATLVASPAAIGRPSVDEDGRPRTHPPARHDRRRRVASKGRPPRSTSIHSEDEDKERGRGRVWVAGAFLSLG